MESDYPQEYRQAARESKQAALLKSGDAFPGNDHALVKTDDPKESGQVARLKNDDALIISGHPEAWRQVA